MEAEAKTAGSDVAVAEAPAAQPPANRMSARDLKVGTNSIAFANAGEMLAFARLMSEAGDAVPVQFRGKPGACLAVISDAVTFGMQPFQLARQAYFVNGMLAYMAQAISAIIIARAPIKSRPKYEWKGEGGDLECTVTVVDRETGETITHTSPKKKEIKVQNSPLWVSDPRQQMGYYTVRSMARLHFPEVLMGIYDLDEAATFRREIEAERPSSLASRLPGPQAGQEARVIDSGHIDRETGSKPASDAPSGLGEAKMGDVGITGDVGGTGDEGLTLTEGDVGVTGQIGAARVVEPYDGETVLERAARDWGVPETGIDLVRRLYEALHEAANRAEVEAAYALFADEVDAASEPVQKFCADLYQQALAAYPESKKPSGARKKL